MTYATVTTIDRTCHDCASPLTPHDEHDPCPRHVWAVICPDESIRHNEPFPARQAATRWACWQHSCIYPADRHVFQRLDR